MELVLSPGRLGGENNSGSPFQNQEVREWSHVDRLTGMLEHARIETDRWQTRHQGTAQAYGKVIDSRERNSADGNVVQKARRQVEVFQSQGAGGRSVQVVRASQWSSSRITDSTSSSPVSVSMNGNEEPTAAVKSVNGRLCGDESLTKLSQVSRLCRQINEEAAAAMNRRNNLQGKMGGRSPVMSNRLKKFDVVNTGKEERSKLTSSSLIMNSLKSTSNEDLTKLIDSGAKSQMIFTRDCKARRSLQIPKSVVGDFERSRNDDEIRVNPEGVEFDDENKRSSRNSPSSDHDVSVLKNERKRVKSYVLGMEEADSESANSSLSLPKPMMEKKILFNGSAVDENGKDNIMRSEYLRPTPILLKPKSNTTVVHLNNKFLDLEKNAAAEVEPISVTDKPMIGTGVRSLMENDANIRSTNAATSRVQSLANRFANGNSFKSINEKVESMMSQNSFAHNSASSLGKKQLIVDSGSRIEGLISRSTVISGAEHSVEMFPPLLEKKSSDEPSIGSLQQQQQLGKPVKKVGFCKTEVHFAAESGKVNIVETDCKPPPSNRFRRRRRNSIAMNMPIAQNKNLPLIHFGDTSYEKYIFGQSNGSFKSENFNPQDKLINDSETNVETDLSLKDKNDQRLSTGADELIARDGWRARLKTIMQSEPPPIITDENDDVNGGKNFDAIDETIVDHSFKGSHTTTVNLGANVISKLQQKHTNEGKCNTISTGIQLQFNTRVEKLTPVSSTSDIMPRIDVAKNNPLAKNFITAEKNTPPYSVVVSSVSKIPRPLIQTQQSVLKSAHLVMNLNRIKNFNSIVKSSESNNSFSTNCQKNDNSLTLKHLLSSLQDNCTGMVIRGKESSDVDIVNNNYPNNTSTLITINGSNGSSMNYKNRMTNSNTYPTRFPPLRLKHLNDYLNQSEDRKRIDDLNDSRENQLQYSSGSEQADEEVRSYMLGSKIHRSYTQHKKCSHSQSVTTEERSRNVQKSKEEHSSASTVKETRDNDDSIDNIDQNHMIDDELENIVNSGLPVEEICFEANGTVEKNHTPDKMMSESNVVTLDNENNKVLMNIVTTHEPVIARVEDSRSPETRRELFSCKKLRSRTTTQSEEKEKIIRETHRSNKSLSSSEKKAGVKHKAKDLCDNKSGKEVPSSLNDNENKIDPTYVNVFENVKKSVPIYENYRVMRKNNLNDKKYSKNVIQPELNAVMEPTPKSSNGNCDPETNLSNTDCEEENFKHYSRSRDADGNLTRISERNSIKKNNRDSQKIKPSKTKSKRIVRPPSSTSSIESIHRSSGNETAKDSEAKPLHTKSTRSSRLHRVTSVHETSAKETVDRYSSNDKKKITTERTSIRKLPRSNHSADTSAATKNDQASKSLDDSTRSKKPIEIVYQTAVFNMKNEKLAKSSRSKESKTPRYINDLICGIKPKRSTDVRHVKGTALSQQRVHHKSASPTNRHWK